VIACSRGGVSKRVGVSQDAHCTHLRLRSAATGQVIFREGDEADGLDGVVSGRVVVTVNSPDGKEPILSAFGPGTIFGEIFLDGRGRARRHAWSSSSAPSSCRSWRNGPARLAKQVAVLTHDTPPRTTGPSPSPSRSRRTSWPRCWRCSREVVSRQLAVWREAGAVEIGRGRLVVHDRRFSIGSSRRLRTSGIPSVCVV
jgi:hypothetical protein